MKVHFDIYVNDPNDLVEITWEVEQYSGSTICPAWAAQHEIEQLEKAGYRVLSVAPHK